MKLITKTVFEVNMWCSIRIVKRTLYVRCTILLWCANRPDRTVRQRREHTTQITWLEVIGCRNVSSIWLQSYRDAMTTDTFAKVNKMNRTKIKNEQNSTFDSHSYVEAASGQCVCVACTVYTDEMKWCFEMLLIHQSCDSLPYFDDASIHEQIEHACTRARAHTRHAVHAFASESKSTRTEYDVHYDELAYTHSRAQWSWSQSHWRLFGR